MEAFKLFTISDIDFTQGIKLSNFSCSTPQDNYLLGQIASFPLYPRKQFSAKAQTMLPFSLSFVTAAPVKSTISKQGIILDILADQWIPLDPYTDCSILLDTYQKHVLLYCPVGETYLRSCSKTKPKLLQVSKDCVPVITEQNNAKLDMTLLGNKFVSPVFNSEALEFLSRKLRCKAAAKRPKTAPTEAHLGQADESSSDSGKQN